MQTSERVRLTQYSHGAGCGCKIAPAVLEQMLAQQKAYPDDHRLLVGNSSRDDAAALDLGNGQVLISTTDFFMPIVDDAHTFGRIAATNAISDVYAMGGTPVLAIAILGWPINLLPPEIAGEVIAGGRAACQEAGIALAGGHSIDNPEPVFGLAVSGIVQREHLKRNDTARPGDLLYLTKPLGVGILTTAEKKGLLREQDMGRAASLMTRLNHVGARLGTLEGIHAMTDVTGFGLLGHLAEMCEGSGLRAELEWPRIPTLADLDPYLDLKSTPGGTRRNWDSYGHRIGPLTDAQRAVLCDPQTSGGLLVAVDPSAAHDVEAVLTEAEITPVSPIGRLRVPDARHPLISV